MGAPMTWSCRRRFRGHRHRNRLGRWPHRQRPLRRSIRSSRSSRRRLRLRRQQPLHLQVLLPLGRHHLHQRRLSRAQRRCRRRRCHERPCRRPHRARPLAAWLLQLRTNRLPPPPPDQTKLASAPPLLPPAASAPAPQPLNTVDGVAPPWRKRNRGGANGLNAVPANAATATAAAAAAAAAASCAGEVSWKKQSREAQRTGPCGQPSSG